MIKVLATAVIFLVVGWCALALYAHGVPIRVEISAPLFFFLFRVHVISRLFNSSTAPKTVQKPTSFDDGIDYGRTHPAYTTPGIGYYNPPRT